jgi:alpha-D-xyloside xylohydrolase
MSEFRQIGSSLIWEMNHERIKIEPWGSGSLRVRATKAAEIRDDLPNALLEPDVADSEIEIGSEGAVIRNGPLAAEIAWSGRRRASEHHAMAKIRFVNPETGRVYLEEQPLQFRWPPVRHYRGLPGGFYHIENWFKAYDDERIYGLGQHQHGHLDQKGSVIELTQLNTEVNIPFLLSSRGYGFLWNNPAVGRVELGENHTRWVAEATQQLDYWVTAGDTPRQIMANYADATGHAPMLPEWAAGFWQCKLRYRSQEELLEVAREYERRGLPLSVIVIDFFHWTVQGEWRFDPEYWPDPVGMVRELEDMGVKVMVSIWPTVNPLSENFQEMQERGLLVRNERGLPAHKPFRDTKPEGLTYVQFYDATNPEAREFIWEQVKRGYYDKGIRVWWLDACEPDMYPTDPDNVRFHLGNGLQVFNIYPLMHARAFYEGMRSEGEDEIISLCRSAWAGSQRYGAAVWSGDIESTFEALQDQVRAGLNIALSGIPWWTTDIGGFFDGDPDSPYFRELIVRWFQYGVFCPLFRLHGYRLPEGSKTGGPNEVWSFGERAYEIITGLLSLRERLRPYIMEQMQLAHEKGTPPMRPLFFDLPDDDGCIGVDDQFMFGPDLLVAPVLHQRARSREVYLPAGTSWTNPWTEETLEGGQWVTADAPLDRIPVYLRGQATLPIRSDET